MPYSSRDPNSGTGKMAHQYPVPRALGLAVLIAAVVLFALRHVFGSITISAGTN